MPNHRTSAITAADIETAYPWQPDRWAEAEPQSARGEPGSRGVGDPAQQREHQHGPGEWTGVRPLPPILPSMPRAKPGDQAG